MSEIGLIERSTLSGLIEEVKRLSGTDGPLTPKEARTIASTVVANGINRDGVIDIVDDYMNENLDARLDTYMEENLDNRINTYMEENLDSRLNTYMNENLDSRIDGYMNDNLDERLDGYFEENPPIAKITINGEGPDENGNFNIECGSVDSNNVVEF